MTVRRRSLSLDYLLVLATVVVLFAISALLIYAMFAYRWAGVDTMAPAAKAAYMARLNHAVAPWVAALILLLGICIPKRLLERRALLAAAGVLLAGFLLLAWARSVLAGLLAVLLAALVVQLVVLALALAGSQRVRSDHAGYWLRLGSVLVHLGLVLFILDLFLYRWSMALHLFLFWVTTAATVIGMVFCFWSQPVARFWRRWRGGT